ncbi:hypothetical protein RRG08_002526 [Elysia crispata]|uniref:Uncharacterized protein n=1 Tax=Elysia crispata TaxID=231223 RepID=A0AAE1AZ24_9GAST|nr:hypothetical protein RRG08_002526 [Elysia crispata]
MVDRELKSCRILVQWKPHSPNKARARSQNNRKTVDLRLQRNLALLKRPEQVPKTIEKRKTLDCEGTSLPEKARARSQDNRKMVDLRLRRNFTLRPEEGPRTTEKQ